MATVSLLRGRWIPHRTRAQGLVRRAAGEVPAATYDDGLRARNALGSSAWQQRKLLEASWTWLNL